MRRAVDALVTASVVIAGVGWWLFERSAPADAGRELPVLLTGAVVALAVPAVVGGRRVATSGRHVVFAAAGPLVAMGYFRLLEPPWAAAIGAIAWYAAPLVVVLVADRLAGQPSAASRALVWSGTIVLAGAWVVTSAPADAIGRPADELEGVRSATWSWVETIPGVAELPSRDVRRWQENPLGWLPSDVTVRVLWLVWSAVIIGAAVSALFGVARRSGARPTDLVPHIAALAAIGAHVVAAWPEQLSVDLADSVVGGAWYADIVLAVPAFVAVGLGAGATWQELIRPRLALSGDDVLHLDRESSPAALSAELRSALGDPTARLLFPGEAGTEGEWVDEHGERAVPAGDPHRAATVVEHEGTAVAAIEYDVALALQPDLVDVAATSTSLSLTRRRIAALAERDATDARASATRLLVAEEGSRAALRARVDAGPARSLDEANDRLRVRPARLDEVHDLIRDAIASIRELARSETPASLAEHGLPGALSDLAASVGVPIDVTGIEQRLAPVDELTVYLVVADVTSRVSGATPPGTGVTGAVTSTGGELQVRFVGDHQLAPAVVDRIDTLGGTVRFASDALVVALPDAREGVAR